MVHFVQAREEIEQLSRTREDEEQQVSNLNRRILALEQQLHEVSDQVQVSHSLKTVFFLILYLDNASEQRNYNCALIFLGRD